ncbi:MAG TPA: succinate dehydrogenase cytochrome b subunit [Bdellovibrionota bacterium]|nr:succinate dehydrogenase cytochrome b subunit [Bdellovibrionota bacterium]
MLKSFLHSSVGKKIIMAITGLGMIGFLIGHLAGNLTLLTGNADKFNRYSHFLTSLGALLIAVELGLLLLLLLHMYEGICVAIGKLKARPEGYEEVGNAGGPSRKTLSSRTMIYSGIVILVFVFIHVRSFKYGPGIPEGYVSMAGGAEIRDLHRLVVERFSHPGYVAFYVACMILLGLHLRHAFWSAFQSLGVHHPRYTPILYGIGTALAAVLSIGFLIIPLWVFFSGGSP